MSRTSLSRVNGVSPANFCASSSDSATKIEPSSAYQAGIRCPHHNWRLTHQGWMFSIQLKKVFSHVLGTISIAPERTASIGALASSAASTYHWSVSQGSITTPPRSPNGVWIVRGSKSAAISLPSLSFVMCGIRKPASFIRSTTSLRASNRSSPTNSSGTSPSAVCTTFASASNMLSMSAALIPARLPTSKSLKSWPGVIFTAPLPSSGSACSSATTRKRRPVKGWRMSLPMTDLYRSSSGCTATHISASIVSGRVVATSM